MERTTDPHRLHGVRNETPSGSGPFDLHGPRFISNLKGVLLEMNPDEEALVSAKPFKGGRTQQWLLQFHPNQPSKVALASLEDGRYLSFRLQTPISQVLDDIILFADKDPLYWQITGSAGIYSLATVVPPGVMGLRRGALAKFTIPTTPGPCKIKRRTTSSSTVRLLILENSEVTRAALKTGTIGPYAHPHSPIYYTIGTPGRIAVFNHLDTPIYAAMGGSGKTYGYEIGVEKSVSWSRSEASNVHLSLPGGVKSQNATVHSCHPANILHIQSMASKDEWEGLASVLPGDTTYTINPTGSELYIGIQNNLDFSIYVIVLDSTSSTGAAQSQVYPGKTSWWLRKHPEIVLVTVGTAGGAPRSFMGRVGSTLHITG